MLRKLTMEEAKVALRTEWDETPVRGNALASGNDDLDRETEDEILARLDRGDIWAWCLVIVTADWEAFRGEATLGCCCYEDEADFKKGGYWEDLQKEALSDLNAQVVAAYAKIEPLVEYRGTEETA